MASLFGIKKLILVGRSTDRLEAVRKLASVSCEIVCPPVEQKGPPLPALIRRYVPEGVRNPFHDLLLLLYPDKAYVLL